LSTNREFSIPLHNGWNIISNPFDIDIAWSSVQQLNEITQMLHRWNGQFQESAVFASARTGEAFYFFNEADLSELRLPYQPASVSSSQIQRPAGLRLSTVAEGDTLSDLHLGYHPDADNRHDRLDQIAPPRAFQKASLFAIRPELPRANRKRALIEEYLPADAPGYRYELTLAAPVDQPLQIVANGLENFPPYYQIILFDKTLAKRYDLKNKGSVSLSPASKEQDFVLLIGDDAYINQEQTGIVPSSMILLPNYPNPFIEETTIEFAIPEPAPVRLVVYDALGRKIRVLAAGSREAGPGSF
jgi:hypothetical protein